MSQPCLPVPNKRRRHNDAPSGGGDEKKEIDFNGIESMDATEYLSRVVHQAKAMPDVFVAEEQAKKEEDADAYAGQARKHVPIDGSAASLSYLISKRSALTPPPTAQHLPENAADWIAATLSNFERLRTYLEDCKARGIGGKQTNRAPFPPMQDRSGWHLFCVGSDEARGNAGSYFGEDYDECIQGSGNKKEQGELPDWETNIPSNGHEPKVRLVLQMDQVLVRRVLLHLSHYVSEGWSPCSPQRVAWLYALLARLEKPVHRDDAAVLFGLLKELTRARSKLDSSRDRVKIARLNVLIVVVGIVFGQGRGTCTEGIMAHKER